VVSYRVMLDVPRELVLFVSGLLAARRRQIGTRRGTRKLGATLPTQPRYCRLTPAGRPP
jgi:hypothetical protein